MPKSSGFNCTQNKLNEAQDPWKNLRVKSIITNVDIKQKIMAGIVLTWILSPKQNTVEPTMNNNMKIFVIFLQKSDWLTMTRQHEKKVQVTTY